MIQESPRALEVDPNFHFESRELSHSFKCIQMYGFGRTMHVDRTCILMQKKTKIRQSSFLWVEWSVSAQTTQPICSDVFRICGAATAYTLPDCFIFIGCSSDSLSHEGDSQSSNANIIISFIARNAAFRKMFDTIMFDSVCRQCDYEKKIERVEEKRKNYSLIEFQSILLLCSTFACEQCHQNSHIWLTFGLIFASTDCLLHFLSLARGVWVRMPFV